MQVAVIMGSDSDWLVAKEACATLKFFKVPFEAHVLHAHRCPIDLLNYVKHCGEMGCKVFICIAGRAAHLAGVVAAHTTQPVIGVPVSGGAAGGLDSILSTLQMPPGVPVATVGVDGGQNAAILAAQILSLVSNNLNDLVANHRADLIKSIRSKDQVVQEWVQAI